jgi:hypothetical protein
MNDAFLSFPAAMQGASLQATKKEQGSDALLFLG